MGMSESLLHLLHLISNIHLTTYVLSSASLWSNGLQNDRLTNRIVKTAKIVGRMLDMLHIYHLSFLYKKKTIISMNIQIKASEYICLCPKCPAFWWIISQVDSSFHLMWRHNLVKDSTGEQALLGKGQTVVCRSFEVTVWTSTISSGKNFVLN